jgi:hypothetical protein
VRSGTRVSAPSVVTELVPLGSLATWQAERAVGDHDRNTLRLRLDLRGDPTGFERGMTVWLNRWGRSAFPFGNRRRSLIMRRRRALSTTIIFACD